MDEIRASIAELRLGAEAAAWSAAGFAVEGESTRIGRVPVRFGAATEWVLAGPARDELDGLPTELGPPADPGAAPEHPIGALAIDHVVVFTSSLERTIEAFEASRIRCRRVREAGPAEEQLRQAFFRFGEVICEVVEVPEDQAGPGGAARFWGLTITVEDLDRAVGQLGPERCGTIRDAVQPGRRIATIRKRAGLGLPVALITPEPAGPSA